ncbi:MAG: CopD family protein [Bdellovibrionales bacterium]|nr:CopD family protein [Bdellovibrionales bacterium]
MSLIPISLAVHVTGLLFWIGPLLALTLVLKAVAESSDKEPFIKLSHRLWYGFVLAGAALVLVSGLYQLIAYRGLGFYMQQGWFHAKLTAVILLFVLTGLVGLELRYFKEEGQVRVKRMGMYHGGVSALALIIVFLTILSR